jgi:hypothetical protein
MVVFWSITFLGVALDAVVLLRGLVARMITRYPFFYFYAASILLGSILVITPGIYPKGYWQAQLLTLMAGYGILLEILNHVFEPYPGAEKFARVVVVGVFVIIAGFSVLYPLMTTGSSTGTMIEFERDLRTVQAIFICALLGVISYYGIAIGRNMKGIISGYGFYIVTSLVTLATRSYEGMVFDHVWKFIQPVSFDLTLAIWTIAMWSDSPNPVPEPRISLDTDYEAVVARTRSLFGTLRAYLVKAGRP